MPHECTPAEWKILEILWKEGGMSTGQITSALQPEPGWTQNTVCTLLKRLMQKELIRLDETVSMERYVCRLPKEHVVIAQAAIGMTLTERLKASLGKGGTHK
ncbi:MAG: BlaI/MecI/CopY family transcriptional regulator [Clostridia bacterium]|nr:BlaI/MecI/CopY family transcriptional regulator [Clostridia bacterium]